MITIEMTDSAPHTPPPGEDAPAIERPPSYRSYLLRFWEERSSQPVLTVWRFSVEDPHTTQRQSFADLEALVAWLKAEVGSAATLPTLVDSTGGAPHSFNP